MYKATNKCQPNQWSLYALVSAYREICSFVIKNNAFIIACKLYHFYLQFFLLFRHRLFFFRISCNSTNSSGY